MLGPPLLRAAHYYFLAVVGGVDVLGTRSALVLVAMSAAAFVVHVMIILLSPSRSSERIGSSPLI